MVTHCPPLIDGAVLAQGYSKTETEAVLARYHIPLPFALYPASTTHTHKNHTRLLLAWAILKGRLGTRCPALVCTARGHLWPALRALIEALGLQGSVVFTDTVDTATLARLYQSCAFVIVPTVYEGGGSGPVVEACLAGKPVLCSRIPQIEEQIHYYGLDSGQRSARFFPADSVDGIVDATERVIDKLSELEFTAREDQRRVLPLVPRLWEEWARFYAKQIRGMVTD